MLTLQHFFLGFSQAGKKLSNSIWFCWLILGSPMTPSKVNTERGGFLLQVSLRYLLTFNNYLLSASEELESSWEKASRFLCEFSQLFWSQVSTPIWGRVCKIKTNKVFMCLPVCKADYCPAVRSLPLYTPTPDSRWQFSGIKSRECFLSYSSDRGVFRLPSASAVYWGCWQTPCGILSEN